MTPEQLKASILQYAIQGKLVERRPEEGTGEELYQKMQTDKQTLIREKKIKKEKPLPDIIDNEIPFDVPESWKWVKVGNVGSWSSGATPSRTNPAYYGGSIPWLKTGDLNDGFIQEVPEYITDLALEKTSLRLNPIGSVLMAMYGATIGKLGILEIPVTTNQACCACIPYAGMNNKYLFYYLMSMRQSYIGMAEGGAQPNISKEKIVNSLIPLPPAEEQRRIVAKIEELLPYVDRYGKSVTFMILRSLLSWRDLNIRNIYQTILCPLEYLCSRARMFKTGSWFFLLKAISQKAYLMNYHVARLQRNVC